MQRWMLAARHWMRRQRSTCQPASVPEPLADLDDAVAQSVKLWEPVARETVYAEMDFIQFSLSPDCQMFSLVLKNPDEYEQFPSCPEVTAVAHFSERHLAHFILRLQNALGEMRAGQEVIEQSDHARSLFEQGPKGLELPDFSLTRSLEEIRSQPDDSVVTLENDIARDGCGGDPDCDRDLCDRCRAWFARHRRGNEDDTQGY